jgi:hypothetical protein
MKFKLWLRGLLAAAINSAVSGLSVIVADSQTFNLSSGIKPLLSVVGLSAVTGALLYLKQHPLPDQDELDTMQIKREQVDAKAEGILR